MQVLVLGGTHFLGRHFVEQYLSNPELQSKYQITLFNRGKSNPNLFNLPTINGDRDKDFDQFEDFQFDVVLDFCGHYPCSLKKFIQPMLQKQPHYMFVSSCSVYDHEKDSTSTDEKGVIVDHDIDPNSKEYREMTTYGARKYLCEQVIRENFQKHTILRPGLIVGAYDSSFRFPYWIKRLKDGGEILAPEAKLPIQFIDAHDIAAWMHHLISHPAYGDFNVVGETSDFQNLFASIDQTLNLKSDLHYASEQFLRENEVGCWMELPLWIYSEFEIFSRRSPAKAKAAGLTYRPIKETILETSKWLDTEKNLPNNSYNLQPEKEFTILSKLKTTKETSC